MDVSTLRMFFDSQGYYSVGEKERETVHRAMEDIVDTFNLYKRYLSLVQELGTHNEPDDLDA
jgi:hypothetical protein